MTKPDILKIIYTIKSRIHPPVSGMRDTDLAEIKGMEKMLTVFEREISDFQEENIEDTKWIIWSIEHTAWWAPDHRGYTTLRERAGVYSYADALDIVKGANIGEHNTPNEAMVRYYEPGKLTP